MYRLRQLGLEKFTLYFEQTVSFIIPFETIVGVASLILRLLDFFSAELKISCEVIPVLDEVVEIF